jgi:hypothetical protein
MNINNNKSTFIEKVMIMSIASKMETIPTNQSIKEKLQAKIFNIADKILSLISSSYRDRKVEISHKTMVQLASNSVPEELGKKILFRNPSNQQEQLADKPQVLKQDNIDTTDALSSIEVEALNEVTEKTKEIEDKAREYNEIIAQSYKDRLNEFPDFLKDIDVEHLLNINKEIEDKANEYNEIIANKKQDEDLAKFNQYLANNPGALAGYLLALQIANNRNKKDVSSSLLENKQPVVSSYSEQEAIQISITESSLKENDLIFVNEFIFNFLSSYINGKITAESDPQDRVPMIFQLFKALENNNSHSLSEDEKKQVEELAFKSYLKIGLHGLYNRLKLNRNFIKADSPKAAETYEKLFLALEPALKKDFPNLKINEEQLKDAIKKTGLDYDLESDKIAETVQQVLEKYPHSGDPDDRQIKNNNLYQQLAEDLDNPNKLFLDPDYSIIQEKKKQFDQLLEKAYLDPNLTKKDLENLEKEQEKEIQMIIEEQQQKVKATEEAYKERMRQQLKRDL